MKVDGPAAPEPNDDVVDGVSGLTLECGNLQIHGQAKGRTDGRIDEHLHCEPSRHGGLEAHARFGSAAACRVRDLAHVIEIPRMTTSVYSSFDGTAGNGVCRRLVDLPATSNGVGAVSGR